MHLQLQFIFTSFLSRQVSIFTHLHYVHFSVLSMHYRERKTLQPVSIFCYITDIRLSRITLGSIVVCYITDDPWRKCRLPDHGYNALAMTLAPAAMLCPGFCTGSWQKRSKRIKYCGSIHTLRPPPGEGGDVCKVWLRSVQKCGFE
jgi:hypothetical protein